MNPTLKHSSRFIQIQAPACQLVTADSAKAMCGTPRRKQTRFTLIELLVVIAIIGILAAVGVVAYNGYTDSAKRAKSMQQHKDVLKVMVKTAATTDLWEPFTMKFEKPDGKKTNLVVMWENTMVSVPVMAK